MSNRQTKKKNSPAKQELENRKRPLSLPKQCGAKRRLLNALSWKEKQEIEPTENFGTCISTKALVNTL